MSNSPTIYVVDDHHDACESVLALARSKGMPAKGFASAEEFLAAYQGDERGCLVVDVRMTGISGLELQERLSQLGAKLPVIIITGFAEVPTAVKAMRAGALTFLEKPCPEHELWANVAEALDVDRDQEQRRTAVKEAQERLATLTTDEVEVLRRLLEGMPNKRIASELDIGLRTVELRRATILKKMQADSLAHLVRATITAGFLDG